MSQPVFSNSLFKQRAEDIMPLTFQDTNFKGIKSIRTNVIQSGIVLSVMEGLRIWAIIVFLELSLPISTVFLFIFTGPPVRTEYSIWPVETI